MFFKFFSVFTIIYIYLFTAQWPRFFTGFFLQKKIYKTISWRGLFASEAAAASSSASKEAPASVPVGSAPSSGSPTSATSGFPAVTPPVLPYRIELGALYPGRPRFCPGPLWWRMQRSSTSLPALAQQLAHLTLVKVTQESIPVQERVDRVHPPNVLSVLVLVGEDW